MGQDSKGPCLHKTAKGWKYLGGAVSQENLGEDSKGPWIPGTPHSCECLRPQWAKYTWDRTKKGQKYLRQQRIRMLETTKHQEHQGQQNARNSQDSKAKGPGIHRTAKGQEYSEQQKVDNTWNNNTWNMKENKGPWTLQQQRTKLMKAAQRQTWVCPPTLPAFSSPFPFASIPSLSSFALPFLVVQRWVDVNTSDWVCAQTWHCVLLCSASMFGALYGHCVPQNSQMHWLIQAHY